MSSFVLTLASAGGLAEITKDMLNGVTKIVGYAGNYTNVVSTYKDLKQQGDSLMRIFVGVGVALFKDCGSDYVMGKITNGMTAYLKQLGFSENRADAAGSGFEIGVDEAYGALKNQLFSNKEN